MQVWWSNPRLAGAPRKTIGSATVWLRKTEVPMAIYESIALWSSLGLLVWLCWMSLNVYEKLARLQDKVSRLTEKLERLLDQQH